MIIALIIIGVILQGIFIAVEHKEKYVAADILKGCAAFCFVIIGIVGYMTKSNDSFGMKLMIGLIFGMIGDILLNLRFVVGEEKGQKVFLLGIVSFLIGHILYLAALIPQAQHAGICVCIGALLAAALLAYIFKTMDVKLAFKIFGVFYLGAVIIMTVMAIDTAVSVQSIRSIEYAIGAVLFMVSDIVLIFNTFSGTSRFSMRITNLSLYYIGQMMIALSLFL
ncbi:MAG: lysoplasmalogenase [Lachnospiraceae bacterium]|nr:lysoplasmalogenase [Lachnospiraceae bacterium]